MRLVAVDDVVAYRWRREPQVERSVAVGLPTPAGTFTAVAYRERDGAATHLALVRGEIGGAEDVVVAVHSECPAGDILRATACTCRAELEAALERIGAADRGVLVVPRRRLAR